MAGPSVPRPPTDPREADGSRDCSHAKHVTTCRAHVVQNCLMESVEGC
jgi:hypothetical protein